MQLHHVRWIRVLKSGIGVADFGVKTAGGVLQRDSAGDVAIQTSTVFNSPLHTRSADQRKESYPSPGLEIFSFAVR